MAATLVQLRKNHKEKFDEAERLFGKADATDAERKQAIVLLDEVKQLRQDIEAEQIFEGRKGELSEQKRWSTEAQRSLPFAGQHPGNDGDHLRPAKSLGALFVESKEYKSYKTGNVPNQSAGLEIPGFEGFRTKATMVSSPLTSYDRVPGVVLLGQQRLTIADLLAPGTTNAPTIRYMRENSFTNGAATVLEGGTKPEAVWDLVEVDAPVRKIAITSKVSDELFADFDGIRSYMDERLTFSVGTTEEVQLLNGNGVAPNVRGLLQIIGIQAQAKGTDSASDAILKAITKVRSIGFFEPDGIVINPTDWQNLRLLKDNNLQYYGGGPFSNSYGNGPMMVIERFWGLPVVVTTAIAAGTALVGAFRLGSQIFRRQGITIESTNCNEDDFKKNLVALRAEERLALAVYRPLAFCTVTGL